MISSWRIMSSSGWCLLVDVSSFTLRPFVTEKMRRKILPCSPILLGIIRFDSAILFAILQSFLNRIRKKCVLMFIIVKFKRLFNFLHGTPGAVSSSWDLALKLKTFASLLEWNNISSVYQYFICCVSVSSKLIWLMNAKATFLIRLNFLWRHSCKGIDVNWWILLTNGQVQVDILCLLWPTQQGPGIVFVLHSNKNADLIASIAAGINNNKFMCTLMEVSSTYHKCHPFKITTSLLRNFGLFCAGLICLLIFILNKVTPISR